MGFQNTDETDGFTVDMSTVTCSICLEVVSDYGDRSWAKLLCGHQFHLDCIGSAFNAKGAMQCPNCRKVEKGQWLFANGGCDFPELNADDWAHEEDLYVFRYPEMSLGVHWCPFNGLTQLPTSFNEGEFASNGCKNSSLAHDQLFYFLCRMSYSNTITKNLSPRIADHDLLGQHAISMEHASVSSGSHPCPYVAYVSPLNPSSSNLGTNVSDGSNFSGHWTINESPNSYALPSMDVHYHSWDHPSPHITATNNRSGSVEQTSVPSVNQRYSRPSADISRSASFMQPLQVGHSSGARAGSMASSSMTPPYPGSNARARDRVQALQAYYQQRPNAAPSTHTPTVSGSSRRVSHRGVTQVGSAPPPSHQNQHGFQYLPSSTSSSLRNYMESENPMPRGFRVWERDQTPSFPSNQAEIPPPTWGTSFHHPSAGLRFNSYRQGHASERASSHHPS